MCFPKKLVMYPKNYLFRTMSPICDSLKLMLAALASCMTSCNIYTHQERAHLSSTLPSLVMIPFIATVMCGVHDSPHCAGERRDCFQLLVGACTLCILSYAQVMVVACCTDVIIFSDVYVCIPIHAKVLFNGSGVWTVSCCTMN